ncbi:MAG: UPF0149 family protein [Candidatus Symbiodolus clandestinus]
MTEFHRAKKSKSMEVATINQQPLSDEELDIIDEILSRFYQRDGMSLEGMDGLFAAIICSGIKSISILQCVPALLGVESPSEKDFSDQQEFQLFLECLKQHWQYTEAQLASGRLFLPLLYVNQKDLPLGNDWAAGFLYGASLCEDERWDELMRDREYEEVTYPILSLVMENNPDPTLHPFNKPIGPRKRKQLPKEISHSVTLIYNYFNPYRHKTGSSPSLLEACQHTFRKIESDDLCPCGSGFIYRQCCSVKQTLH